MYILASMSVLCGTTAVHVPGTTCVNTCTCTVLDLDYLRPVPVMVLLIVRDRRFGASPCNVMNPLHSVRTVAFL